MAKGGAIGVVQIVESKAIQKLAIVAFLGLLIWLSIKQFKKWQIRKGRVVGNDKKQLAPGKDYGAYARRLYTSMSGAHFGQVDRGNAMSAYMSLNDSEFIEVYNLFNDIAESDNEGTLRQWLIDEFFVSDVAALRASILSRMDLLNMP